jgi:hypothetical protein
MDYIRIDSDNWDDVGIVYAVLEYSKSNSSTAVTLILENVETKKVTKRVVANHQIVWLQTKDS